MGNRSYIFSFVYHYLKAKKYRFLPSSTAFFCILTLTISVASLIVVKSVMNGFRKDLIEAIISINSHVNLYPITGGTIKSFSEDVQMISNLKSDVEIVSPIMTSSGMISKNGYSNGVIIKAFDDNKLDNKSQKLKILGNRNGEFEAKKGIVIGIELANRIGVKLDSTVNITVPKIVQTAFGSYPINKDFKVVGYIRTGSTEYDASVVIIHADDYRAMLGLDKREITEISIYLKDYEKYKLLEDKIFNLRTKYRITNWEAENYGLMNALKTESAVMSLILSLFILISMTGIFVVINNMVKEKEREIGIMYSMGIFRYEVLKIFFFISVVITGIGLLCGLLLGIFVALNLESIRLYLEKIVGFSLFDNSVYLISKLPSRIDKFDVLWTIVFVSILSMVFSLVPAFRASKKSPVEILRSFYF